jgi:TolB-like protein/Tfp pilus assembly protein PilF
VPLTPKAFDTLVLLVENSGHLLEKAELMRRLWPDTFVEEFTLTRNIADVRKALGDGAEGRRYILTVPKRGYRFVVEVQEPNQVVVGATEVPTRAAARRRTVWAVLALLLAGIGVTLWLWRKPDQPSIGSEIGSLAVLPFKSLDPAERDLVLELGLTDALISRLSSISEISVRSIGAVRRYLDVRTDPLAAGRALRVDAVLEGSIQRDDGARRVTARLLRVHDGKTIWTGTFHEQPTRLFTLEDSVATHVAAAIAVRLTEAQRKRVARHPTESAKAYDLYVKGRYFWAKRNLEGLQKAIGYFEQAMAEDPGYALAYVGLADSLLLVGGYSYTPQKDVIARTRAALGKALQLDDGLAEAHTTLALVHQNYDWDWPQTEREYRLAIQRDPNYAIAHSRFGEFLAHMGRFDESLIEMERALQLDPVSLIINTVACKVLYFARQYDKAIEQCRRVLEMDPRFDQARYMLPSIYFMNKMYPEVLAEIQKLKQDEGTRVFGLIGSLYAGMGNRKAALKFQKLLEARAMREYVSPFSRWGIPLLLGDHEEALSWLEKTYETRDVGLIILKVEPVLDPLRGKPRFQTLLRKMNF